VWKILNKLLVIPGVHYVVSRYAPNSIKRLAFEEKMKQGVWDYTTADKTAELLESIGKYAHNGNILCLGCGSGSLVEALSRDSFKTFIGVDLSRDAIEKAKRLENDKIIFHLGDIYSFECNEKFNIIVFEESIYYIPPFKRLKMLKRYQKYLTDDGVFIVTANYKRFAQIFSMIKKNFTVLEERCFKNSSRYFSIFR
jgi:trans-aconitate methyltransferase